MVSEAASPFEGKSIEFGCCYCDKKVERSDSWTVVLVGPDDEEQTWWCHRDCFVESLHPTYRVMRDEWDESGDEEYVGEPQQIKPMTVGEVLAGLNLAMGERVDTTPPVVPPVTEMDEYRARRMRIVRDDEEPTNV